MTSIIISGRPNSEEMSECIIVAKNIANMYPSSRFTIVLKSPKEWEKYCEDLCNLFGILKKTHPLILLSNGNKIGGAQEFFKLIYDSFKYDKLIKKNNEYVLDIDPSEITKLTRENTLLVEKEYFCRTKGKTVLDKINDKLEEIPVDNFSLYYKVYVKYNEKFTPDPNDYIDYKEVIEQRPAYADKEKYNQYHQEIKERNELEKRLRKEAEEEAKRKLEEEQRAKEEANKGEEENKETDESNTSKKNKKKKKEEEERKRKEEKKKRKEKKRKKKGRKKKKRKE